MTPHTESELHPKWLIKTFDELTVPDLYAILRLRQRVFVAEQNCPFVDADNKDQASHHLCYVDATGTLLAYARLLPVGAAYANHISIGRVVCSPQARKTGLGRALMQKSIETIWQLYGFSPIKIQAQAYLTAFYESLGFVGIGQNYLDDGIWHVDMLLHPEK